MDDLTAKYNHIIHTISGMMQIHETGVSDDLPYSMIIFTGVFRLEQNKIFSVFIWRQRFINLINNDYDNYIATKVIRQNTKKV